MNTKTALYSLYILMWPALSLGILLYILRSVVRDAREAKKQNKGIV